MALFAKIFLLLTLAHIASLEAANVAFERLPIWPGDGMSAGSSNRGRYVFRDDASGEIVISYPKDFNAPDGPRVTYRYRPQNQVAASIRFEVSVRNSAFTYTYAISNGSEAALPIEIWALVGPGPESDCELRHPAWRSHRMKNTQMKQAALQAGVASGDLFTWSSHASPGLAVAPGGRAVGFTVNSSYLPGFTTAYANGGPPLSTDGDLPLAVAAQLEPLMKFEVNNQVVPTLGPRFAPDARKSLIASDYLAGLKHLARVGVLEGSSEFFRTALSIAEACERSNSSSCLTDQQAAALSVTRAGFEEEVRRALLLALR